MFATRNLVTVVCTANVCRSVFASTLLAAAWSHVPVEVRSAGVAVHPRLATCPLVGARLAAHGFGEPRSSSQPVSVDLLAESALVLTMTPKHRAELALLLPEARSRILTLVEASVLADALTQRSPGPMPFTAWCDALIGLRGRVPMPLHPVKRRGLFSRERQDPVAAIDIPDGHTSDNALDHDNTLLAVEAACGRLVNASLAVVTTERNR